MIDSSEGADHCLSNGRQFLQCNVALVQLTVANDGVNDLDDNRSNVFGIGPCKGPCRGFARIGKHHYSGLFKLRFGPGITEVVFIYSLIWFGLSLSLPQEIMKRSRTMVLRNKISNPCW